MVAVFFTFALSGPLPPKEMGVILSASPSCSTPPSSASSCSPSYSGSPEPPPGTAPPGYAESCPKSPSPTNGSSRASARRPPSGPPSRSESRLAVSV
jgi:hypothetical protein